MSPVEVGAEAGRAPRGGGRADHVLADPDTRARRRARPDRTLRRRGALVVRPKDTGTRWPKWYGVCRASARRSPSRAATPAWSAARCRESGEIVLSLVRLDDLDPVEPARRRRSSAAPASRSSASRITSGRQGLDFPVDFAARGLGDDRRRNGATNAGGALAARYGMTRAWVAGLSRPCSPTGRSCGGCAGC